MSEKGYDSAGASSKGSPNLEALALVQDQLIDIINNNQLLYVEKLIVDATATGGTNFTSIPVGAEIVEVLVQCTATNGSGTLKLTVGDGGSDITDTIACATLDAIDRAASVDQTYKYVTSDGIDVVANGNDDRGEVYVSFKK